MSQTTTSNTDESFGRGFAEDPDDGHSVRTLVRWAAIVLCSLGDVVMIAPVMTIVLGSTTFLGPLGGSFAAVVIALLALMAMYEAGRSTTNSRILDRRISLLVKLYIVFFLLLAFAMTALRWNAGVLTSTDTGGFEDAAAAAAGHHDLVALCLLPVFVITGALAYGAGLNHPTALVKRYRTAKKALRTARATEETLIEEVGGLTAVLVSARNELRNIDDRRRETEENVVAMAARAKEHGRHRIAVALGDPSATDILRPGEN